jgi:hypothetical protein
MTALSLIDTKSYFIKQPDQIVFYEYVERISVVNMKKHIKQLLPLSNDNESTFYYNRDDYVINNNLSWHNYSLGVAGLNLIDLFTYLYTIPVEFSYKRYAEYFKIDISKNICLYHDEIPGYRQESKITIYCQYIMDTINLYNCNNAFNNFHSNELPSATFHDIIFSNKNNAEDINLNNHLTDDIKKDLLYIKHIVLQQSIDYDKFAYGFDMLFHIHRFLPKVLSDFIKNNPESPLSNFLMHALVNVTVHKAFFDPR